MQTSALAGGHFLLLSKAECAEVFCFLSFPQPWYTEVRLLLQDQTKWGWFVPYAGCRNNATGEYTCKNSVTGKVDATANLYHDEEQTPGWTGGGNGGPSSPFRVPVCAARTLSVKGQSRSRLHNISLQ